MLRQTCIRILKSTIHTISLMRLPIRWHWAIWVGMSVMIAIVLLSLMMLNMERHAWLQSQTTQAEVLVERLADEMRLPMLSGSTAEVGNIAEGFINKVPAARSVHVRRADNGMQRYGEQGQDVMLPERIPDEIKLFRPPATSLWYVKRIEYANTAVGAVAVRFSEQAWKDMARDLMWRMFLAACFVLILACVGAWWIAKRMSKPMEEFARGAQNVADGDYTVRLPVYGNNEISDAAIQFNHMVGELAHKEEMRNTLGRYLNPNIVDEVFDGNKIHTENMRKNITVLFADMISFTSFSESTSTEIVLNVVNTYFEVFHRIISSYGGHVDKYIGDAVMAVFNHPRSDTQHAKHAAMAALTIAEACKEINIKDHAGVPIAFRIGINSGEAIAGKVGAAERLEYTVMGATVNVASRMAGQGVGNEVTLAHDTFIQLGDGFEFTSIGKREIKGVSQPMECGTLRGVNTDICKDIRHKVAIDCHDVHD